MTVTRCRPLFHKAQELIYHMRMVEGMGNEPPPETSASKVNQMTGSTSDFNAPGTARRDERTFFVQWVRRADGSADWRASWYRCFRELRVAIRAGQPIQDVAPIDDWSDPFLNGVRMNLEYRNWSRRRSGRDILWVP